MVSQPDAEIVTAFRYRFTVAQIQHALQLCQLIPPFPVVQTKSPAVMFHQICDDDLFFYPTRRVRFEVPAPVLTSKYAEHTPLYRQSEIYGHQGVELSRSLLSGWVDACCRMLSPLEEALRNYVLTDGKLHADDTPVPVLLPGYKKAGPYFFIQT